MKVFPWSYASLSNTLFPLLTAALVNTSAEVGKEKSQLGRAPLTMTSFPGGLAQPVLGLIARRPGFAPVTVPLGAGAIPRIGWGRSGAGGTAAWGRSYRSLGAAAGLGTAGTQRHGVGRGIHLRGESARAEECLYGARI